MRSKWEILTARVEDLERQAQSMRAVMRGMDETPCVKGADDEHIHCGTCGVRFESEGDFARHYVVPDERFLNLGNCPSRYAEPKLAV